MTILQLTSTLSGGAGIEVLSMHRTLIKLGHDSYIINRGKYLIDSSNNQTELRNVSNHFSKILRIINRLLFRSIKINLVYAPYNLYERFLCYDAKKILESVPHTPDIIFVKWASDFSNARFLSQLKKYTNSKIIISFIDQAPLTGGCHYPNECEQFMTGCGDCPMSESNYFKKCVKRNFQYKKKFLPHDALVWVASTGDYELVKMSPLYQNHRVIKNLLTLDADKFVIADKYEAKIRLGIDPTKKVILCGSSKINEPRKGIKYLVEAINQIKYNNFILLIVGGDDIEGIKCEVQHTGYLNIEQLISTYQAADIFVCPSVADSGPLMINQSIMIGTPVVSFPIGVSKDLVHTMKTGYLAKLRDAKDLAKGIDLILSLSENEYNEMSIHCREFAVNLYNTTKSKSSLDNFIKKITK